MLLLLIQFTGVSKTPTDSIKAMQRELDHPLITSQIAGSYISTECLNIRHAFTKVLGGASKTDDLVDSVYLLIDKNIRRVGLLFLLLRLFKLTTWKLPAPS